MNCRQAQLLLSPYLDQRLSGAQMLDMERHLQQCARCADERRAVQQVRLALRALPAHIPRQTLEARLVMDAARPALFFPGEVRLPRRGRRLASALMLSGVGLLTLSAPFAPAAFDGAAAHFQSRFQTARAARFSAPVAVPGTVFVVEQTSPNLPGMTLVHLSPLPQTVTATVPPPRSLPASVWGSPDPLQTHFAPGADLSFAGYHSR